MSSGCNLVINGRSIKARIGETLVSAALGGWVVVPHDCCSGQCESCRVTVIEGAVNDQGTGEGRTVLACQATLEGDAEIAFDIAPALSKVSGLVSAITPLSPDIFEVRIELQSSFQFRPGQYVGVKFSGFPARDYSPTVRLDGSAGEREIVLHIRRLPGGIVSTQLGATIRPGHRVQVRGPFGQAFLRDEAAPLVLVAGGTGWAPIWALAHAALLTQAHRDLVVIAGATQQHNLYMGPALDWLSEHGVRDIITTAERDAQWPSRPGRPTHYLPSLGPEDVVYVAGPPALVDAVKEKAIAARARCYADPFIPSATPLSFVDRVLGLLRQGRTTPQAKPSDALAPQLGRTYPRGDYGTAPSRLKPASASKTMQAEGAAERIK